MEENMIQNVLTLLGVGRRFHGFSVAVDAIHLAYRDETALLCFRSGTLKHLATQYGCSCSAIERNLRTVIRHAWLTNPKLLQQMAAYPLPEPPSVIEFVDIMVAYLHRRHRGNR